MKNEERAGVPRHIAVIMDGNGRWAAARALPRPAGHRMGVRAVKQIVENCARRGVEVLTLFAFSSENWKRPQEEVSMLMSRFLEALDDEVDELHKNGIRLRFIGNLRAAVAGAARAHGCRQRRSPPAIARMTLVIAIAYGGRWDIACAARELARRCVAGELRADDIDEAALGAQPGAGRSAGSRPVDPHRRRAAHQQFPAVESRLHRAVLLRHAVAGLRRARARRCDRAFRSPAAPLRARARAGRRRADAAPARDHGADSRAARPAGDLLWLPHAATMAVLALLVAGGRVGVVGVPALHAAFSQDRSM